MRALFAAVLSVLLFEFCGVKFGVRDRFEGMNKGALRVYIRLGNPSEFDEDEAEKALGNDIRRKGLERAALIAAAGGIDRGSLPSAGKIVFLRCNDEFCEAFIDYRIRERNKDGKLEK